MAKKNIFFNAFVGILRVIAFVAFCTMLAFIIVYPLFHFANKAPRAYTVTVIALIILFAIYRFVLLAKKTPVKKLLLITFHFLVITLGLSFAISLVLNGRRFFALLVLIALPAIYIGVSAIFQNKIVHAEINQSNQNKNQVTRECPSIEPLSQINE
ncbi:MAG: hypothetical protein IJR49_06095 [Treponema sp.]|nr:hypothetical protein [Treponema sp.]